MPVLTLLERTRARQAREAAASARSSSPTLPSSPSFGASPLPELSLNVTPNPFTSATSSNTTVNRSSAAQRKAFGDRMLKKIKLESSSQAEFTQFIEMASQDERDALQVAYTLRLTDLVTKSMQETVVHWTPPKSLEKALRPLIYGLLLMPNIRFYSGNLTSVLMVVARDSGIKQLPDDDDCDALAVWLNRETNNAWYLLKKTILESLAPNSDIENIAALTNRLLSSHAKNFNATLSLYFRIALIRYHAAQKHAPNAFWGKIDDDLDELYKEGPEAVVENLKTLYEDDVEEHGDPAKSDFTTSTEIIGEKRPKWYRHVHNNAPKIQRVGKVRAAKRKRDDEDEEEEDEAGRREGDEQQENIPPADEDDENPNTP